MRARGWRFAGRVPEAPSFDFSSSEPSPPVDTTADDSARQTMEMVNQQTMLNQQLATDAANAATQQMLIQQYENSFIQQQPQ
jgi:hypothetical protein